MTTRSDFDELKMAQKQALQVAHARMAAVLARCSGYVDARASAGDVEAITLAEAVAEAHGQLFSENIAASIFISQADEHG